MGSLPTFVFGPGGDDGHTGERRFNLGGVRNNPPPRTKGWHVLREGVWPGWAGSCGGSQMIEKKGRGKSRVERASPAWQSEELGDYPVGRREP